MSTKTKKIISFLEGKFPLSLAEEWDKPGLVFGSKEKEVEKIIVALDLTHEVFDEAIKNRVDMIITHHPFLWQETLEKEFQVNPWKKEMHTRMINTGIAVYSIHTNYDVVKDGMSAQIAKVLNVKPKFSKYAKYGFYFEEHITLDAIERKLKETLNVDVIQTSKKGSDVNKRVAIIPGSAGELDILAFNKDKCDLVITSDVKWSTWVMANEMNIGLVSVSHSIEDVFTKHVASLLLKNFKDVEVMKVFATEFEI